MRCAGGRGETRAAAQQKRDVFHGLPASEIHIMQSVEELSIRWHGNTSSGSFSVDESGSASQLETLKTLRGFHI